MEHPVLVQILHFHYVNIATNPLFLSPTLTFFELYSTAHVHDFNFMITVSTSIDLSSISQVSMKRCRTLLQWVLIPVWCWATGIMHLWAFKMTQIWCRNWCIVIRKTHVNKYGTIFKAVDWLWLVVHVDNIIRNPNFQPWHDAWKCCNGYLCVVVKLNTPQETANFNIYLEVWKHHVAYSWEDSYSICPSQSRWFPVMPKVHWSNVYMENRH